MIATQKNSHGGPRPNSGRPAKPDEDKRIAVQLSLTPAERDKIDDAARNAGMTRSAFVLNAVDEKIARG